MRLRQIRDISRAARLFQRALIAQMFRKGNEIHWPVIGVKPEGGRVQRLMRGQVKIFRVQHGGDLPHCGRAQDQSGEHGPLGFHTVRRDPARKIRCGCFEFCLHGVV